MSAVASRPLVNNWTSAYVGKPWASGHYGPHSYDCWGLVHSVYLTRLGVDLPHYPGLEEVQRHGVRAIMADPVVASQWVPLDKPEDLCLVVMGQRVVDHVGVYVAADGGRVLHSGSAFGVVCQPLQVIRSQFSKVQFYALR